MTFLFARFILLLVLTAGIAVAALSQGQLRSAGSGLVTAESVDCISPCASPAAEVGPGAGEGRRSDRRALRWQSFLPGTFR